MTLKPQSKLRNGEYIITRFLGQGGFGCTYEATDTAMATQVAIKEFFVKDFCNRDEATGYITLATQSKREFVEKLHRKFVEEARAIFKMKHDNIVRVHSIFEENGTAYYVMEYIDGQSLSDILKKKGKISESEAVGYIRQIADALKYVHAQNRLHLDVKPANILINKKGEAILIDFGASKHYDEGTGENTTTMQGLNTPGFAPYEQTVEGITKFAPASDIYALGATMYKLLTGVTPPNSGLLALKKKTLAPLPDSISAATRNAIYTAMQLHEEDRPQTIDEFLALLDSAPASKPTPPNGSKSKENGDGDTVYIDTKPKKPVQAPEPNSGNKNMLLIGLGLAAAAVVAAIAIALFVFSGNKTEAPSAETDSVAVEEVMMADSVAADTMATGSDEEEMNRQAELREQQQREQMLREQQQRQAELQAQQLLEQQRKQQQSRQQSYDNYDYGYMDSAAAYPY